MRGEREKERKRERERERESKERRQKQMIMTKNNVCVLVATVHCLLASVAHALVRMFETVMLMQLARHLSAPTYAP